MANMIGMAFNYGSITYGGSDPLANTHGQVNTSGSHVISYGNAHLRMDQLSAFTENSGLIIGRVGIASGQGSALQVASFTTTQRGYLTPANGMILYNSSTGQFEGYNAGWISFGGGGNTLDQAYDQGGAGSGRQIVADSGSVLISGGDGLLLADDNELFLGDGGDWYLYFSNSLQNLYWQGATVANDTSNTSWNLIGGLGGTGVSGTGGTGSDINVTAGLGGPSTTQNAGSGGDIDIKSGQGGTTSLSSGLGGNAGTLYLLGGLGGNGGVTSGQGGTGGSVSILAGNGGTGNTTGDAGDVVVNAGVNGSSSVKGTISIGNTNASTIQLGNATDSSAVTMPGTGDITLGQRSIVLADNVVGALIFEEPGGSNPILRINTSNGEEMVNVATGTYFSWGTNDLTSTTDEIYYSAEAGGDFVFAGLKNIVNTTAGDTTFSAAKGGNSSSGAAGAGGGHYVRGGEGGDGASSYSNGAGGTLYLYGGSPGDIGGGTGGGGGGNVNLETVDISTSDTCNTGSITIETGLRTTGVGNVGLLSITGGDNTTSAGNAGSVYIYTGSASGSGSGGYLDMTAGSSSSGNGGGIYLYAGDSTTGEGGFLDVYTGSSGGTDYGGSMYFTTGNATGTGRGGDVYFDLGYSISGDRGGIFQVRTGATLADGGTSGYILLNTRGVSSGTTTTLTGDITLEVGDVSDSGVGGGGNINLYAGDGQGGSGGGDINLSCGDDTSTGVGGTIAISSGDAVSGSGGAVTIYAGNSSTGTAGSVTIQAGEGVSTGATAGNVIVAGGTGGSGVAVNGGRVEVRGGNASGTGINGDVYVYGGASNNRMYLGTTSTNISISFGTGAPSGTPPVGSLYVRTDNPNEALYMYKGGGTGWTAIA